MQLRTLQFYIHVFKHDMFRRHLNFLPGAAVQHRTLLIKLGNYVEHSIRQLYTAQSLKS